MCKLDMKESIDFPGYYLTKKGEVFNSKNEKLKKSLTTNGYHTVFINGKNVHVHYLILNTFDKEGYKNGRIPNHFDLNKLNNRLDNLDWVTIEWNNIHTELLYRKNPDRPHIEIVGDEKLLFNTIDECSAFLGCSLKEVWFGLKNKTQVKNYTLRYLKSNDRVVLNHKNRHLNRDGCQGPRPIKVLDLRTRLIKYYSSLREAAINHNVCPTIIRHRISYPDNPKIFDKRYIISDVEHSFDYLTDGLLIKLLNRGRKEVVSFNTENNTFSRHKSASLFMKDNNLWKNRKTITTLLRKGKVEKYKGHIFIYSAMSTEKEDELYLIMKYFGIIE